MIATETTHAPRKLVHRESCLELFRYQGNPTVSGPPVVLVYSFINRPTVLDLLPQRSVVRSLVSAGHDVFLVNWGDPTALESTLDLEGHCARLERALRVAATTAG